MDREVWLVLGVVVIGVCLGVWGRGSADVDDYMREHYPNAWRQRMGLWWW